MPSQNFERLSELQGLSTAMSMVQRNHQVPGTEERHETVTEHVASAQFMAHYVNELLDLGLDMAQVDLYLMTHDLTERGLPRDYNAYGDKETKAKKEAYESAQLEILIDEFSFFPGLVRALRRYHGEPFPPDPEAHFVDSIEKMQAIIADQRDGWRAHQTVETPDGVGVSYEGYIAHHAAVLERCYPPIRDLMAEVIEHGRQTYYMSPTDAV